MEAQFWTAQEDHSVICNLCRHHCHIQEGKRGICHGRVNRDGALYNELYGGVISEQIDPIEKKPLYHVLPGSASFSIALPGCNFRCRFCQNYSIAQPSEDYTIPVTPRTAEEIVDKAIASGSKTIACTYTEPTIWYEYLFEIAEKAYEAGIKVILVTNGYIEREPLKKIAPFISAANIDLKAFKETTYKHQIGASLYRTLDSIRTYHDFGIFIEITTLVIPDLNDSDEEIGQIAKFIHDEIGADTPWHLSAFYPTFKMLDRPRTSLKTLEKAREIGLSAGLKYVYLGNVGTEVDTFCPSCGELLVKRTGYNALEMNIVDGCCRSCKTAIAGIWK